MTLKHLMLALPLALPSAAFAATSNVDIYGLFSASVDIVNFDDPTKSDEMLVSSHASRFGFRGSEDLGGGLSAVWGTEAGLSLDDGSGNWGSRGSFVGLSSKNLGKVILGGQLNTLHKMSTVKLDVFSDSLADYNGIIGQASNTGAAGNRAVFDARGSNAIQYTSPSLSGVVVDVMYSQKNEGGSTTNDPQLWSLAANYSNGPLYLTVAWEKDFDYATTNDRSDWKFGAAYTFGNTRLAGVYERMSQTGSGVYDRNAYYVSVLHKMGNIDLKAAYGRAGDSDAVGGDDGANLWAVGGDYNLSKRTAIYAIYASLNNDSNGRYTMGQGTGANTGAITPTGGGQDPSGFSLGVRHTF